MCSMESMETQEIKQTSPVTCDEQSRNALGMSTACADKDALTNVHENTYPKLLVKLEKLDIIELLEAKRKNKYPKATHPDSIPNSENIVTSSTNNNNQKDYLEVGHQPHTMSIKQEKNSEHVIQNRTNSSDDTSKSDTNSNCSNISSLHSKLEIKQEKVIKSSTNHPKTNAKSKVSKTTSNHSKVYNPGTTSKPTVQQTASKTRSETNWNYSSSKTSKPSQEKSNNYIPFDGATFFLTQMRTSFALQTILKDIATLNNEYHYTDDRLLDLEIEKLRAKNKLPSLRNLDPFTNIEDSESLEDSCQESDDEVENLGKDSGFDNESQESESNSETRKNPIRAVKDDKTSKIPVIYELNTEEASSDNKDSESEMVIINEPDDESEDEPDYVHVDRIQSKKRKCKDVISINGTLMEIEDDILECPFCAKEFRTMNILKLHIQPCLESKLPGNISTSSETSNSVQNQAAESNSNGDAESNSNGEAECNSNGEAGSNSNGEDGSNSNGEAASNSIGDAESNSNGKTDSNSNGEAESNSNGETATSIKIERVFSVVKEMIEKEKIEKEKFEIEKIKINMDNCKKVTKFRRTCKDCDLTFFDQEYLDDHFQKTGHKETYPLTPCNLCKFIAYNPSEMKRHITFDHLEKGIKRLKTEFTSESNSTEIIEIDD